MDDLQRRLAFDRRAGLAEDLVARSVACARERRPSGQVIYANLGFATVARHTSFLGRPRPGARAPGAQREA